MKHVWCSTKVDGEATYQCANCGVYLGSACRADSECSLASRIVMHVDSDGNLELKPLEK